MRPENKTKFYDRWGVRCRKDVEKTYETVNYQAEVAMSKLSKLVVSHILNIRSGHGPVPSRFRAVCLSFVAMEMSPGTYRCMLCTSMGPREHSRLLMSRPSRRCDRGDGGRFDNTISCPGIVPKAA
ncbi:hypothetical protein L6452_39266 [Arctium lappa]|uniref:Uncharacterized protein n=1 Tax=Arctium lappa TaxID=4217 RepID=A0ACB8XRS8_ARCLA|nr:hypothetical protein L6452_39266 [Arctium lappa]